MLPVAVYGGNNWWASVTLHLVLLALYSARGGMRSQRNLR